MSKIRYRRCDVCNKHFRLPDCQEYWECLQCQSGGNKAEFNSLVKEIVNEKYHILKLQKQEDVCQHIVFDNWPNIRVGQSICGEPATWKYNYILGPTSGTTLHCDFHHNEHHNIDPTGRSSGNTHPVPFEKIR
jgi:hypothetical protein